MSVLKRIRKCSLFCRMCTLIGIASILGTGCASPSRTSWKTTRTYESSPQVVRTSRTYDATYRIEDPTLRENTIVARVLEDLQQRTVETRQVERWETREEYVTRGREQGILAGLFYSALFGSAGYLVATHGSENDNSGMELGGVILLGMGVGFLLATLFDPSVTEPITRSTGRTENRKVGTRRYDASPRTSYTRRNHPAANIPVRFRSDHYSFSPVTEMRFSHNLLLNTGRDGNVSARMNVPTGNFLSRSDAISEIHNHNIIANIRHQGLRDLLIRRASDFVVEQSAQLSLQTEARRTSDTSVNNASRTFTQQYYSFDATRIYPHIARFIDENINSQIQSVTLTAEDIDTRIELADVNFLLNVSAPTRRELAAQYFSGPLIDWAANRINDYASGEMRLRSGRDGTVNLRVFLPSRAEVELRRERYHFIPPQGITFERNRTDKTFRMSETGTKMRVDMIDGGRLFQLIE